MVQSSNEEWRFIETSKELGEGENIGGRVQVYFLLNQRDGNIVFPQDAIGTYY